MPTKLTKEQFDALIAFIEASLDHNKFDDLQSVVTKRKALEILEKLLT